MQTEPSSTKPRLIPIPDWNQYHPWPPVGGLRHLRFNSETNGFARAFVKVGRRVLIDEAKFFECVEKAAEKPEFVPVRRANVRVCK